ncbi:RHS domain-containing protein, partial [Salmonella enterica subsp. enterica serovar Llandoff]|nr:RHS domain-containing protein [Salmonella enterica subsp. enterica serovar Llandoff]
VAETPVQADGTAVVESSVYWLYEPGALTPGARYEKGQLHYVVRDHMGTPRELLTESGEVVWAQKLSVWGRSERYRFGGWNAANDESGPGCPWRYAGQWEDEESGLYYNRFRYYDSEAVQYLTPDPIGLTGGINNYSYVPNPLKYIDPLGLCKGDVNSDFFANTKYTDKVIAQMKSGDLHSFPESVRTFQDAGTVTKITGGDGIVRDMLKIPGRYRGKNGNFEFIKEPDGSINHRLFKPDSGQ